MIRPHSLRSACLVWLLALTCAAAAAAADTEPDQPNSLPQALLNNDPLEELELLKPAKRPDELERDKLHAAALFAHGRMLQNRGEYADAIQRYQRAWRYHPEQVSILDLIVALAFELKRNGEAARYAVIAAERNPKDGAMVRRLAMFLAQQQDYARATTLYEKAIEIAPADRVDIGQLLIGQELSRLYLLQEAYDKAAEAAEQPFDALENPKKYDLSKNLLKALEGKPEQTYRLFGESFVRGGKYDLAEKAFRKAHEAEANQALLDYSLARVAAGKGNRKQALELLDKYFDANGSTGGLEAYELYAELIGRREDDPTKARETILSRLKPLRENDPANAALGIFVAGQLVNAEQYDAAEEVYRDLLSVSPSLEVFNGLIALEHRRENVGKLLDALGQAVARAGDFQAVEESADEVLEDKALVKKLIAEAARRIDAGEELDDGVALAAGLLAIEAEDFGRVEPLMKLALENGLPSKTAIVSNWGLGMLVAEQHQQAAEVFQNAIDDKLDPDNEAAFYYYLASALGMSDRFDDAVEAAKKAAELRPTARFKSRIAWLHYYAGKHDSAVEQYETILDEYADEYGDADTREVVSDVRSVLSAIAVKQERITEAVEYLERVLDEFPEDVGAHNDLGYLWADENMHLQRAHAMITYAVTEQPENKAYRDSLGWILFRLGRVEEAIVELEKAAEDEDPDGVILEHLADAYAAAGRSEDAKRYWERAVEAFEEADDEKMAKRVREKLSGQK